MECYLSSRWLEVFDVSSSSVNEASQLTRQIRGIQKLRTQHGPVVCAERLDHACPDPYPQANSNPGDDEECDANAPNRRAPVPHDLNH